MDAGLAEIMADDDGQELIIVDYLLYHEDRCSFWARIWTDNLLSGESLLSPELRNFCM